MILIDFHYLAWYAGFMGIRERRQFGLRFETAKQEAEYESFCRNTTRDELGTLRAIVKLFFADGPLVADNRLCSDLWEPQSSKGTGYLSDGKRATVRPGRNSPTNPSMV